MLVRSACCLKCTSNQAAQNFSGCVEGSDDKMVQMMSWDAARVSCRLS